MGRVSSCVKIRQSTLDYFNNHKWVILIRDTPEQDWRLFCHHYSGRIMKYTDLDKAIYALKNIQGGRYRVGNAKLSKLEDYENATNSFQK